MKSLKITSLMSLILACTLQSGYSQAPVIDESGEYSLAMNHHEISAQSSISKSAEADEDLWENEQQPDNQATDTIESQTNNEVQANENQPLVRVKEQEPLVNNTNVDGHDDDSESLAEQVHNLQAEIQELRGQIEVQAHDLKMLQQQQLAFYKDLDSRLQNQKSLPTAESSASVLLLQFYA